MNELTPDELYVLQRFAGGARAIAIALEMKLKPNTVYAIAFQVRTKLKARTLEQACYVLGQCGGKAL